MPEIIVVNIKAEGCDWYVGRSDPRPSALGNIFSHSPYSRALTIVRTREEAIARYRRWLATRLTDAQPNPQKDEMARLVLAMRQHDGPFRLGCHCKPLPCHGDIVARAVAWWIEREGVQG